MLKNTQKSGKAMLNKSLFTNKNEGRVSIGVALSVVVHRRGFGGEVFFRKFRLYRCLFDLLSLGINLLLPKSKTFTVPTKPNPAI